MRTTRRWGMFAAVLAAVALVGGCDGGQNGDDDADAVTDAPAEGTADAEADAEATPDATPDEAPDAVPDETPDETPDVVPDEAGDAVPDGIPDGVSDVPDGEAGVADRLGTNNQDITGVERVIFLGDSITATPYLTQPWSDRIRPSLRTQFGDTVEILNYAVGGARTEHVRDEQIPRIDTSSTKKTLVMFTIGGNDALQVIGEDVAASLAHMTAKIENLRDILEWLADPAHFPGGVYVVFANLYDPTDGEGDFTHCGIGAAYSDWPAVDELATTVNGWYRDLADEFGFDVLDAHELFLGHGWNSNDAASPYYCHACDPACPCARWLDFTCIHPNSDGHTALADFFFQIVVR